MGDQEDVSAALRRLTDAMLADIESRSRFADSIAKLETTVNRFVVAMERQLSAHDAAQRSAERVLNGVDPGKMAAMKARLSRAHGRK